MKDEFDSDDDDPRFEVINSCTLYRPTRYLRIEIASGNCVVVVVIFFSLRCLGIVRIVNEC